MNINNNSSGDDTGGSEIRIQLQIEALVLQGLSYHDHPRIRRAIEQELSRLMITEQRLSAILPLAMESGATGTSIPKIDAGSFSLPQDSDPKIIGTQIARMIYKGLTENLG